MDGHGGAAVLAAMRPAYALPWEQAKQEFMALRGSRKFWLLPLEQREGAVKALTFAYLYADDARAADEFELLMDEYRRREWMTLTIPFRGVAR